MNHSFELTLKKRYLFLTIFCLINFITGGLYVWSVFAGPLAAKLAALGVDVSSGAMGPVFGVASGLTPVLMIAGGVINDRMGPRAVIATGGALICAGYLATVTVTELSWLYFTYGILVGAGTGLVNGCTINTAVKFFPDRRGFAGGIVTASLGFGAVVLPLVAKQLIDVFGIDGAFTAFAVASGIVIVPLALITQPCPAGFAAAMLEKVAPGRVTQPIKPSLNWLEMIQTRTFYPLMLLFVGCATMGLMMLSSISGVAQSQVGVSAGAAAFAVSVISLANTGGRFLSGVLSDRIGRVPALLLALTTAIVGLGLLTMAGKGDVELFYAGIVCIGLCFGASIGIYPGLVADEYGPKNNSVNFSVMMLSYSIGGLAGPLLIGWANTGGDFSRAYMVCAAAAVFGILCGLVYLQMKKAETRKAFTHGMCCSQMNS